MKRLNIKLPKALLATIVSLGGLATVSVFGNINRAVANEYTGENNQMSQQMNSPQQNPGMRDNQMQQNPGMRDNQMQQNQQGNSSANETIVGAISDRESFGTLAKAVEAAGLADTLQNTGEYTVFAPTDQAFENLPPGTLEALLQPENQETLRRILQYHVVLGEADSSTISSGFFETAEGSGVNIDVARGMVQVEGATVTEPDIQASNGVIHAVDQVILPPDISAAQLQELTAAQ
ncbi:MAG: fasciclin domain-containing protein [Lyngbya sp.]|nr:fasciclin domain-containing protein [Lyngbya sp.]